MLYHSLVPNPIPNLRLHSNYIDASSRWLACSSFLYATSQTDIALTVFEYDQVTGKLKGADPVYSYPMGWTDIVTDVTTFWQPNLYMATGQIAPRVATNYGFNRLLRFSPAGNRFVASMYKGTGNRYAPDFQLVHFYHDGTSWSSSVVASGTDSNTTGMAWSTDGNRLATITTTTSSNATVIKNFVSVRPISGNTLGGSIDTVEAPDGGYATDMMWVSPDSFIIVWSYYGGWSSTDYHYLYTLNGTDLTQTKIWNGTTSTLLGSGTGFPSSTTTPSTSSSVPISGTWSRLRITINGFKGTHVDVKIGTTVIGSLENLQYGFTGYAFDVLYNPAMGSSVYLSMYKPVGSLAPQTSGSFTVGGLTTYTSPFVGGGGRFTRVSNSRVLLTSYNGDGKDFRDYSFDNATQTFTLNPVANAASFAAVAVVAYPFKGNAVVAKPGYYANTYVSNGTNFAYANTSTTVLNQQITNVLSFLKQHESTKTYTLAEIDKPIQIKPL